MDKENKTLFPFQELGSDWLAGRQNALLADQMGLGKTSQAIRAADKIDARNILVVCPGIARANWEREFQQWQQVERSLCPVYDTKTPLMSHDVVICSYNGIRQRSILEQLLARRWDRIICDESHMLKSPDALSTHCAYGFRCDGQKGLVSKADGTWLLTGTPTPNGPHEIWTHLRALYPEAVRGLEKYNDWMEHFCITRQSDYGKFVVAGQRIDEWVARVRPFTMRRQVQDVLPELPPMRFGAVVVKPESVPPLPPELKEAEQVIKAALQEDEEAVMWAASAHLAALRRWTGIAKAYAVAETINEDLRNGLKKLVIFAVHREVIQILGQSIPHSEVIYGDTPQKKRQERLDRFQDNTLNNPLHVLILNMQIASTNLTLTAASDVAFAETTWVHGELLQAAKRCHRIGQSRPVLAKIYSLANSLDETVNRVLLRKAQLVTTMENKLAY